MNTENIIELQNQVEELSSTLSSIQKAVNALKINDQHRLDSNSPIPPGIACKVAYDKNGLVVKGTKLDSTDIPELSIDKITNLKQSLDSKASSRELEKFKSEVTDMINPVTKHIGDIVGTGVKINYNADGRIVSTADLLPSDIPTLTIDKIEGLSDIIESLNIPKENSINDFDNNIKIHAGTYSKVTVDQYGKVVSGSKLDINDIPNDLIIKINNIESKIPLLALSSSINNINKELINKVTLNEPIKSGTYTKVKVDSKGLVIEGDKLTIKDLPELNISDIEGLDKIIKNTVDRSEFMNLNDTVSSLANSLNNIGEITGIKNELKMKASDEDVKRINSKVITIQNTVDSLVNIMPSDMINAQLNQIMDELSVLNGRISVIERQLNIV